MTHVQELSRALRKANAAEAAAAGGGHKVPTGAIVGSVVAGVLTTVLLAALCALLVRQRMRRSQQVNSKASSSSKEVKFLTAFCAMIYKLLNNFCSSLSCRNAQACSAMQHPFQWADRPLLCRQMYVKTQLAAHLGSQTVAGPARCAPVMPRMLMGHRRGASTSLHCPLKAPLVAVAYVQAVAVALTQTVKVTATAAEDLPLKRSYVAWKMSWTTCTNMIRSS